MIKWTTVSPPLKDNGYIRGKVGELTLFTIEMNPLHKNPNATELEKKLYGKKYQLNPLMQCFSAQIADNIDTLKQIAESMCSILVTNIVDASK